MQNQAVIFDTEYLADKNNAARQDVFWIGAIIIDTKTFEQVNIPAFDRKARPFDGFQLTQHLKSLTGATQEEIDSAPFLNEVTHNFKDFIGTRPIYSNGYDEDSINTTLTRFFPDSPQLQRGYTLHLWLQEQGVPLGAPYKKGDTVCSGQLADYLGLRSSEDVPPHRPVNDCTSLLLAIRHLVETKNAPSPFIHE